MNKEKVVGYLKNVKPMHKYLAVTFILILVVGLSLVFMKEDEYSEVYKNLAETDRVAILNEMQKLGVEYQENAETGSISVKNTDVTWVRNEINEMGLPNQIGHGYENFFDSSLGTTQSEKDLRELASRKGQLERDIVSNFSNIEKVSVQLVMPENGSIFEIESEGGSASILIKQKPKVQLTNQQISGLQHMVATAVPGIDATEVKIIDNELGVISLSEEEQSVYKNAYENQLKIVADSEKDVTDKVRNSLSGFFGQDNIEISVNMSINFDEIDRQIETYGDVGTLRSAQRDSELIEKNNGAELEAEAGVEDGGEVTTYENQLDENGDNYRSEASSVVENFEINKTVENIKKHPELTNTNIVVWVDRTKMREKGLNEKQFADSVAIAAGLTVLEDGTYANGQISVMQIDKEVLVEEPVEEVELGALEGFLKNNSGLIVALAIVVLVILVILIMLLMKRKKRLNADKEEKELLERNEEQNENGNIEAMKAELQKMNAGVAYKLDEMTDEEIKELIEEKRSEILNDERNQQMQDMLDKEKIEIKEKKMREVEEQIEKLGGEYPNETAEYLRQLLK